MFDRASIVSGLCRRWIQQERLSEREWLRLQEHHRTTRQDLEATLLTSPDIDEAMLLEGLAEELGCRFWRGQMLVREVGGTIPPSLPIAINFFAHRQIAPLSWDEGGGILHLVMPCLPTTELLVALKSLLPIAKLHLELASKEAILSVLEQWMKQSSKITMMHPAAGDAVLLNSLLDDASPAESEKTQAIEAIALAPPTDEPDPMTAPTANAAAFVAPTTQAPSTGTAAFGHFSKPDSKGDDPDATYTVLPIISVDMTLGEQPPASFPGQVPRPIVETMEKAPPPTFPGTQQEESSATQAWAGVASQVVAETDLLANVPEKNLPTGDLRENDNILQANDSDFFLDYQAPVTPAPSSLSLSHLDENGDPALPTAMGADEPLDAMGSNWTLQASPPQASATPPSSQPAAQPVLDLLEEFEEVPKAPPKKPAPTNARQASPAPTQATQTPPRPTPTPPPKLAPGAPIFTSDDDELFGGAQRPTPPPRMHQPSASRPATGIAPAPIINPTQASWSRPKPKPKSGKKFEQFFLRYILGSAVGLLNIAIRVGVVGMICYLVWYLFLQN